MVFRLARRLNHTAVYPVDFRVQNRLGDIMSYARTHDPGFVERFDACMAR